MITFDEVKSRFSGDYCYTFNLNPDPSKVMQYSKLIGYLQKNKYDYWLVKCLSPSGFLHYHGMIKINLIKKDIALTKKALAKQVNLLIGRSVPLQMPDSLVAWYRYVRAPDNIFISEEVYKSKIKFDDLCELADESIKVPIPDDYYN